MIQTLDAFRRFSILKLQSTFAALPLLIVTQRTSRDPDDHAETGRYILALIESNQLNASLSQPSGDPRTWIVRFAESSSPGSSTVSEKQMHQELKDATARIIELGSYIKNSDRKLALSKEYVERSRQAQNKETADGNGAELLGYGDEMDEDLNGDL